MQSRVQNPHRKFKSLSVMTILAATLLWSNSAQAGPEGQYRITGSNPGGAGKYSGNVTVTANNNVYEVVWRIGNSRYTGVGIFTNSNFSVAYYGANLTGVAVYQEQSDGIWNGVWAVKGSGRLGTEVWTPK